MSVMMERFQYDDAIVRQFMLATLVWGFVGMLVGIVAALQLANPALNLGIPWLSFGRIRPLHTNAVTFAFAGNAIFTGVYYSSQRLLKTRMFSDLLSRIHFWGWQAIIVSAAVTLPLGFTQGKEYAELEWPIDIAIALVWVQRRALAIREKVLGPNARQVASALRAIGSCVPERGSPSLVMPLLRRAQTIDEETVGDRHSDLALTLARLGYALRLSGDYDGAKVNLERAATILERSLGVDSPLVAIPLVSLGQVLVEMGEYPTARVHLERALTIWLPEYGRDNADVAVAINNLATLHFNMGDYLEEARMYGEAERILETVYGSWHPKLTMALQNHGIALAEAGRPAKVIGGRYGLLGLVK